jgi:glutamate synthase domain-containing protein 2
VYGEGYEWINHSMASLPSALGNFKIPIGNNIQKLCHASVLNMSAMSFGALSPNAIRALNKGAARGGFYRDTGEGAIARYHREFGGRLVPGMSGDLPSPEVSPELAEARGVPVGKDVVSPARHSAFTTPLELMQFLQRPR